MRSPDLLMTYNVNFGQNVSQIIEWLGDTPLDQRPKVACFQEFPDPYVNHWAGKLQQIGYDIRFASAIEKQSLQYGQLTAVGLGSFIKNTHEVDFGFNKWEKVYPGIKGRSGRRSALVTTVRTEDRTLQVVNIHQPLIASDNERLQNILKVEQTLDRDIPAIIAGDQNFSTFLRFTDRNWLIDQMAKLGYVDSGNQEPTFGWGGMHWTVDYITARDRILKNPRVEKNGLSDHEPLFVEIH